MFASGRRIFTAFHARPSTRPRFVRTVLLAGGSVTAFSTTYVVGGLLATDPDTYRSEIISQLPQNELYTSVDPRLPFQNKSTFQVLTSWFVLQLCNSSLVIQSAPRLLAVADALGLSRVSNWVIKHTFFMHFCGGQDVSDLKPLIDNLAIQNIRPILDFSVESALDSALDSFKQSVDHASNYANACIGIKVSALCSTKLLARLSTLLKDVPSSQYPALILDPSSLTFATPNDKDQYLTLMENLCSLCTHAKSNNVQLLVDAEQDFIQPAIDLIALSLAYRFNNSDSLAKPVVFHTYQMYLKRGLRDLERDLELSKELHWRFAAKLVRGAYMNTERTESDKNKVPSPVHDTIDNTHNSYNQAIDLTLSKMGESGTVMVASHNRDSVVHAISKMKSLGVPNNQVMFAQLLGMHDLTTYALAHNKFCTYKYIPYGPVGEVIPYLLRRAQENHSVLASGSIDSMILWYELACRMKGVAQSTVSTNLSY